MSDDDKTLDPKNWDSFRQASHKLLDACIDRLEASEEHPWQPIPVEQQNKYAISGESHPIDEIVGRLKDEVLPYATGNTHPRFFGWVHGSGLASGLLSEMVAATMNSNCGGRDHGAVYLERAVIDWSKSIFNYPSDASGLLLSGTSQATVVALACARVRMLGSDLRQKGQGSQRLIAYSGVSAHNATRKAIELLGIGHDNLHKIPENEQGLDIDLLSKQIQKDRKEGGVPFAIIATAGSVNLGRFDDLVKLSELAKKEKLWLHVDGAFGAWTKLAAQPWSSLCDGIEQADSIACDFHKWMYVPYDCGMVLIRDKKEHLAAFSARPSYLEGQEKGLAGGDPWYCDFGIDLSRGNRALKVWTALELYGQEQFGNAITENCLLASYLEEVVQTYSKMNVVFPVVSNVCVFTANNTLSDDHQSELNRSIVQQLQIDGTVVFSTVAINAITYIRCAITNHRTRKKDIELSLEAVYKQAMDKIAAL